MNTTTKFISGRLATKALSLFLLMALFVASLPQRSLAAPAIVATEVSCASTHTVKSGEYLVSIAKDYKVDWRDIADANELKSPYIIYVGQKLCIPKGSGSGSSGNSGSPTPTGKSASISVSKSKDSLSVTTFNFPTKAFYYVRVDDALDQKFEWVKVGLLNTGQETSVKQSFKLPDGLKNASNLNVCLKNVYTDATVCSNPVLNRGTTNPGSGSGSTTPATWKGSFNAKIVSKSLEVLASKLPANSFFYVRVDNASNQTLEWEKIGILRAGKDGGATGSFRLPENLEKATKLTVCLKNIVNDTVSCHLATR